MADISDFFKIPKIDFHKNLQAGMSYHSYSKWAGFMIPGFPEAAETYDEKALDDFIFYTSLKINGKKDLQNLLSMSVSEVSADNVKEVYGVFTADFCNKCETPAEFIETIKEIKSRFSEEIALKPVLMINSSFDVNFFLSETFIENKVFDEVFVAGKKFFLENIERFENLLNAARSIGVKTKIDCLDIQKPEDLSFSLSTFRPDCLKDPSEESFTEESLAFVRDNKTVVLFSPCIVKGVPDFKQKKADFMRKLYDAGVKIRLCTDSKLFTNKSISDFAVDICNSGAFSVEEVKSIISPDRE